MSDLVTRTSNPFDNFQVLDVYAESGVKTLEHRPDALATISAGRKVPNKNYPEISRDGTIFLHDAEGRAPGLKKILEANKSKKLTITPIADDPKDFLQMRFARYSQTKLEVYGDEKGLTEIVGDKADAQHVFIPNTDPRYEELKATCKVSVSFYFYLAEWIEDFTSILMPDGLGAYRLRFTSRNSLNNILASLKTVSNYSQGRVAGVPFDLQLVNREVADPSGMKRNVPVWTLTMKKPGGLALDTTSFRQALQSGIQEAEMMSLPVPRAETIQMAALEPDVDLDTITLDADDARHLANGIDYKFRLKQWFMLIKGTILEDEQAQHDFIAEHTDFVSRQEAAKYLEQAQWDDLHSKAVAFIEQQGRAAIQAKAEEDNKDLTQYQESITEAHLKTLNKLVKSCDVKNTEAVSFIAWLSDTDIVTKQQITPEIVDMAEARHAECVDAQMDICKAFKAYLATDENAESVLG